MAIDTARPPVADAVRYTAEPGAPRYLTSYIARRAYKDEVQHPPVVNGVRDVIDVHCHAHDGQQDALDLAKYASMNGMRGLLYKSIVGRARPAESVRRVLEALERWAEASGVEPIKAWAGYNIGSGDELASPQAVREQIEDGVVAIWMPTARSANTIHKIGGPPIWWDKTAHPRAHTGPLAWEEARRVGHYLLEDDGVTLKASVREIFHVVADTGVTVSFAHATHPELFAMAELAMRQIRGYMRAFGLSAEDVDKATITNPAKLVGLTA